MLTQTTNKKSGEPIFRYLLCLTGFFLLMEVSFFLQCHRDYLADYSFITHEISIPVSVIPGLVFFLFAQLCLHVCFCVFLWLIVIKSARYFRLTEFTFTLAIWVFGVMTVLLMNLYFFPNSKFAELISGFVPLFSLKPLLLLLCLIWLVFIVITAFELLKLKLIRSLTLLGLGWVLIPFQSLPVTMSAATNETPNIIIIGVDSLRPDALGFFGSDNETPFFDAFLKEATVFSDAVTPLARTFPSWTGILSGEYPKVSGVRYNLSNQDKLDLKETLPAILQGQGYETMFATDETRFSNIDSRFGFDHVVTAPMGLNDFLLGTFNDFPLSNLVVNAKVGRWLFPYNYANRPAFVTYDPDTFLQRVKPFILQQRHQPLFLAIHFCLPHSPYAWASLSAYHKDAITLYQQSIVRVDKQVSDLFSLLKKAHLLDHAMVVLLSDHGETLGLPGDRATEQDLFVQHSHTLPVPVFYRQGKSGLSINESVGHGSDVLGLAQNHALLGFRGYGLEPSPQKRVLPGVVSLLSIKQTLLDWLLHIHSQHSLIADLLGKQHLASNEHIFLESDFTPEAIKTAYPDMREVVLEGAALFTIDPQTTRLTYKEDMGQKIIRSKQFADIYQHWILAYYPQADGARMPILINLNNGNWTNDLHSSFAKKSPVLKMKAALKQFYADELN